MNRVNIGTDLYLKGRIGWRGLSKNEYLNTGSYRIINATSLEDKFINWDICGYITKERYDESHEIQLKEKDILISKDGTLGKIGYVKNLTSPSTVASGVFVLRNTKESIIDTDYLYHFLKSNYFKFFISRIKAQGSTINHLYQRDLSQFTLEVPLLKTQKKIASVLSIIDDKIELNNKINTELEKMAKTIYDYWFVQFDFPEKNGMPYKSSGGKMVRNEILKRDIPEGWEVKTLDGCVEKIIDYRGKTPKKLGSDWSNNPNDFIALSAKHVKNGRLIDLQDANRVDERLYNIWMKDHLKEGDILMTSEAPCGEFFYLMGKTNFCLSQRLFAIRANKEIVNHSYLYYELSSGNGFSQILGKVSGSTVFGIRQDELRTVNILIPDKKLQMFFNEIATPVFQKIRNNDYQNQELKELRDWLLPLLMNGQVVIKNVKELKNAPEILQEFRKII